MLERCSSFCNFSNLVTNIKLESNSLKWLCSFVIFPLLFVCLPVIDRLHCVRLDCAVVMISVVEVYNCIVITCVHW